MTHFATTLDKKNRLVSMLLDHTIMTFVPGLLVAPVMIYKMLHLPVVMTSMPESFFSYNAYEIFAFSLYFNKDIYLGQSIAKKIMKFQILDTRTNLPANPIKCLIRNFTILLWPVEVIAALINPERRIGDYIAGTKLAVYEQGISPNPHWALMVIAIPLGMLFTFAAWFYPLGLLFKFLLQQKGVMI
jgi:hypothetical protein